MARPSNPFVVLARRRVRPEALDAFLEADDALMRDASAADGFGVIYVIQKIENPREVTRFEVWRDQAAHDAYVVDTAHATFESRIADLVEHVEEPRHYGVFRIYRRSGPGGGPRELPWLEGLASCEAARLRPASDADLDPETRDFLTTLPELSFFRLAARLGGAFRPFMELADRALNHGRLNARLRELAILAIAYLEGARYEQVQHEAVASRAGVTDQQLAAVRRGDFEAPILNDDERLILRFARAWWERGVVPTEVFSDALERFGEDQVTELLFICGFYLTAARLMTNAGSRERGPRWSSVARP